MLSENKTQLRLLRECKKICSDFCVFILLSFLTTNLLDFPICCCSSGYFPLPLHFQTQGIYSSQVLSESSPNLMLLNPYSVASPSSGLFFHFFVEGDNAIFLYLFRVLPPKKTPWNNNNNNEENLPPPPPKKTQTLLFINIVS